MSSENRGIFMTISILVLSISVFILALIVLIAFLIKNHEGLEKPNIFKKALCFFMVCLQTFLFMPLFDLIVRTIFAADDT